MRIRNDIFAMILIGMMMGGAVVFVGWGAHEQLADAESQYIMIRKDSLERIITNPCMIRTIEYMGNYILCRRRADYEPRAQKYWPSAVPRKS